MIPPCDPSILENNPQFKRLYENLTINLLNPDGSTAVYDTEPTRKAVVEEVKQCQIQKAKRRLKERMLRQLAFASNGSLPEECQDNLAIISIYLDTPYCALGLNTPPANMHETSELPQDDVLSLLAPDIEAFYSHIPSFILHFSNLLSTAITDLRTIVSTNAELQLDAAADITAGASRNIPAPTRSKHHDRARARDRRVRTSMAPVAPLASQLTDRVATLRRVQLSELPAARREMAATAAAVLAARAMVLERTVMILERAKHGTLARATRAKAEHLATVAQGVEGKLEVMKLEIAASLYTPETTAALARYQQHLHDTRERLNERRGLAIRELKSYGDVEESETAGSEHIDSTAAGTLAQIARRYGMLAREVETVRMEIARLEK